MLRLRTFLEVLKKSLETGLFWICLASRHSSIFDEIYWSFIDSRFYSLFITIQDRLGLLSAEERGNIVAILESKMRQASERTLISHYSIDKLVDL
ncbi:uncharacterized protein N7477_009493 [Penicillium maclennaniae]|uniref:uncharacterized protein n=1 Tax=Penicillium maclennaniae TaxID=1343394 RepID=UPI00253FFD10|nr:uncharacterized protein N7477_009493 [Penicillium maclennaniae]KAJ5661877.1 hypothetical protein N7477_009493 [Penicillium maclennaniae]